MNNNIFEQFLKKNNPRFGQPESDESDSSDSNKSDSDNQDLDIQNESEFNTGK